VDRQLLAGGWARGTITLGYAGAGVMRRRSRYARERLTRPRARLEKILVAAVATCFRAARAGCLGLLLGNRARGIMAQAAVLGGPARSLARRFTAFAVKARTLDALKAKAAATGTGAPASVRPKTPCDAGLARPASLDSRAREVGPSPRSSMLETRSDAGYC
jgi:hypothetical protein